MGAEGAQLHTRGHLEATLGKFVKTGNEKGSCFYFVHRLHFMLENTLCPAELTFNLKFDRNGGLLRLRPTGAQAGQVDKVGGECKKSFKERTLVEKKLGL